MPNNKNILMAAQQVPLLTDRRVRIVPTRSIAQGLASLAAYNDEASLDTNLQAMTEAVAFVWVLGMGSRFAFLIWITHGGSSAIASFSASHSITSGAAWTDALLGMAVLEVLGRSLIMALRRRQLETVGTPELA